MRLQKLSNIDALLFYKTQLNRDFNPQEIKPLQKIAPLIQRGLYHGFGLYEGNEWSLRVSMWNPDWYLHAA